MAGTSRSARDMGLLPRFSGNTEEGKMPTYQGLVAKLTTTNKAEILIKPADQTIPGASEISKRVCHKASEGSTLRIQVVNMAAAEVGDWVLLTRPSGILKKNATALFGMPLLGGLVGAGAGVLIISGTGLPLTVLVFCAAVGLFLGMMAGVKQYRVLSEHNQAVISHVIKKRSELAAMVQDGRKAPAKDDTACDRCTGCLVG